MLMSWQPLTHKPYLDKVRQDVVDLGPMYTRAKLGWVVPSYIRNPSLRAFEDLKKPEVKQKLGSKIPGIDPGAGLMQASEKALKDYGLTDYQLISASDAAMLSGVERAERRKDWIVATAWSPHWMFAKSELRYLDDPKGSLGGLESVNKLVRKGFYQEQPEAYEFLGPNGPAPGRRRSDHVRSSGQQLRKGRGQLHRQEPGSDRVLGDWADEDGGLTLAASYRTWDPWART